MNLVAFLMAAVGQIAAAEAPKVLGWLESKLPGSLAHFVEHVLGTPQVQSWAAAEEAKAEAAASKFLQTSLAECEAKILSHVHGAVGDFLKTKLSQLEALTFSQEQAAQLSVLLAAGKLDAALKAGLADLGVVL